LFLWGERKRRRNHREKIKITPSFHSIRALRMIEEKEFQFDHRAAFPQGPGEGDFHSDASMCNKGEDTKKRNIVVEKVQFGVNASVWVGGIVLV